MWAILSPLTRICCRILFGVASAKSCCFIIFICSLIKHLNLHTVPSHLNSVSYCRDETNFIYISIIYFDTYNFLIYVYIYIYIYICTHTNFLLPVRMIRIRRKTNQNKRNPEMKLRHAEKWVDKSTKVKEYDALNI